MLLILLASTISIFLLDTPIAIGAILILIAFFTSYFINLIYISWFSFIIFLIYIGGLLIIFAYFSALQPNQFIFIETLSFSLLFLAFISMPRASLLCTRVLDQKPQVSFLWEISLILNSSQAFIYLLIANTLFLVLLVVVKITGTNSSPLRPIK